jgi:hypothetical protein
VGILVTYQRQQYKEHLAAVQTMRRSVWKRLSAIPGCSLFISDAAGPVPFTRNPAEDLAFKAAIRVDLSEGTVTVEHPLTLAGKHRALVREGVPHKYIPCEHGAGAGEEHALIRLSLDDALEHLPGAFANALAEIRYFRGRQSDRQR